MNQAFNFIKKVEMSEMHHENLETSRRTANQRPFAASTASTGTSWTLACKHPNAVNRNNDRKTFRNEKQSIKSHCSNNQATELEFYRSLAMARSWSANMIASTKDQKSRFRKLFQDFWFYTTVSACEKTEKCHFESRN